MQSENSAPKAASETPTSGQPAWIGESAVRESLPPRVAVDALKAVLSAGFDPEQDAPRSRIETPAGLLMQMPSALDFPGAGPFTGTKLLTLTPGNAGTDVPVIQGLYQLFGGPTQSPLAVIDGQALTAVRTPAVSALGVEMLMNPRRLERRRTPRTHPTAQCTGRRANAQTGQGLKAAIFGTGVQAWEHARTFGELFPIETVTVIGRREAAAKALAERIRSELPCQAEWAVTDVSDIVAEADVIVTCTSSSEPLFDGSRVKDGAVVVAVGSHDPESRELDDALLARSEVLVESRSTAVREAGEIVQALENEAIVSQYCLTTLREVTVFERREFTRPAVFKTTGMPWEDLALAVAVARQRGE